MRSVLLFGLFVGGSLCVAEAQSYSIDWHKVAGGGGTSTNGQYSLSGTIGQHDAGGPMSGANYSLTGGFWSIYALEEPGVPILSVTFVNPGSVMVSWSLSSSTNYVLMQNTDLTVTNGWVQSSYPITTNGDIESITIASPPPGNLFFRLKQ